MSAFNIYYLKLSNPNFRVHIPSLALLWGMELLPQVNENGSVAAVPCAVTACTGEKMKKVVTATL